MDSHEGYVYMLVSQKDGSLYVGSTNDINRRLREHNEGVSAATRYKRPWKLRAVLKLDHISHARKLEQVLKAQKHRISVSWFFQAVADHLHRFDE